MKVPERTKDIQQACERAYDVCSENEVTNKEIISHLIVSVLSNVRDSYESIIDQHAGGNDKIKGEAICEALGLIVSLYEGTNDGFDLYDYMPVSDDADELTQYIIENLCEI